MTDHDDEMDAILELLEGAGLVQAYDNSDGKQAMRLTGDGERLAQQMAMSDDPDAVLDALLEAQPGAQEAPDLSRKNSTMTSRAARVWATRLEPDARSHRHSGPRGFAT